MSDLVIFIIIAAMAAACLPYNWHMFKKWRDTRHDTILAGEIMDDLRADPDVSDTQIRLATWREVGRTPRTRHYRSVMYVHIAEQGQLYGVELVAFIASLIIEAGVLTIAYASLSM